MNHSKDLLLSLKHWIDFIGEELIKAGFIKEDVLRSKNECIRIYNSHLSNKKTLLNKK